MKTQLLCTFTRKFELDRTLQKITDIYSVVFDKIYVLQDVDNVNEFMCTYNVEVEEKVNFNDISGTISLHRKKHTNTLYTINALNELIKNLNNGILDDKLEIPWENFKNMLLITNDNNLKKINTRIHSVIKV